jgi:hypothetical protein
VTLINLAAFKADYHNPDLRAADVAQRHHLAEGSLAGFAKDHGLKTRKELGIKARAKREPKGEGLGVGAAGQVVPAGKSAGGIWDGKRRCARL